MIGLGQWVEQCNLTMLGFQVSHIGLSLNAFYSFSDHMHVVRHNPLTSISLVCKKNNNNNN